MSSASCKSDNVKSIRLSVFDFLLDAQGRCQCDNVYVRINLPLLVVKELSLFRFITSFLHLVRNIIVLNNHVFCDLGDEEDTRDIITKIRLKVYQGFVNYRGIELAFYKRCDNFHCNVLEGIYNYSTIIILHKFIRKFFTFVLYLYVQGYAEVSE